jgi:hypothetical protein
VAAKIPNGCNVDPMAIKILVSSIERPYKIYPNCNFWFENRPSGNPGIHINSAYSVTNSNICRYAAMNKAVHKTSLTPWRDSNPWLFDSEAAVMTIAPCGQG